MKILIVLLALVLGGCSTPAPKTTRVISIDGRLYPVEEVLGPYSNGSRLWSNPPRHNYRIIGPEIIQINQP